MTKLTATLISTCILTLPLHAEEKPPTFTLKDKVSYSLGIKAGINLNRELLQQSVEAGELNLDMLLKGLQDGLFGNNPLLNETELRGAPLELQKQKHHRDLALQQIKMIAALISTYRLDTGEYPATLEELMTNTHNNKFWRGPYLEDKNLLKDPWGNPYQFHYPGRNKNYGLFNYDLFSYGADGSEGGQEENADVILQTPSQQSSASPKIVAHRETPKEVPF